VYLVLRGTLSLGSQRSCFQVEENVERVSGRQKRQRLLTGWAVHSSRCAISGWKLINILLAVDLGIDIIKEGSGPQHIPIARKVAALAKNPIDETVIVLDIATRSVRTRSCHCSLHYLSLPVDFLMCCDQVKELELTFDDWKSYLPDTAAQREVQPVALRLHFTAFAAAYDHTTKEVRRNTRVTLCAHNCIHGFYVGYEQAIVESGNAVAWRMPNATLQKLRMQV